VLVCQADHAFRVSRMRLPSREHLGAHRYKTTPIDRNCQ
jgi:hypothetical protein